MDTNQSLRESKNAKVGGEMKPWTRPETSASSVSSKQSLMVLRKKGTAACGWHRTFWLSEHRSPNNNYDIF